MRKMIKLPRADGSLRGDWKQRLHLACPYPVSIPVPPKAFASIIMISLPFPALGVLELWLWRQIQLTKQRDADLSQAVILSLISFRGKYFFLSCINMK